MTMNTEHIIAQMLQSRGTSLDQTWVTGMVEQHPAFMLPALMLLKDKAEELDPELRSALQRVTVLNSPDPTALADYIDPVNGGWGTFYPHSEEHQATTEETIDDFLQTFGQQSTPEEDALLERLIFNPVAPDYFTDTDTPYDPADPLALPPELRPKEEDTPEGREQTQEGREQTQEGREQTQEETKTDTIETKAPKTEKTAQNTPAPGDESLLMESLAKIFIKQGRYERAFEIISKLSLNYPEKSVYFADQLRFLQKLMINQQYLPK